MDRKLSFEQTSGEGIKNYSERAEMMTAGKTEEPDCFLGNFPDKKRMGDCPRVPQMAAPHEEMARQQLPWV